MVRLEPRAERHDARNVEHVARQVEVQQRRRFRQKLGERDGPRRRHVRRGQEEPLERRVERECRSQRLDLGFQHIN